MDVQLHIPDDVARIIQSEQPDLSRAAVEALALEGYRSERLSESQVRRLLLGHIEILPKIYGEVLIPQAVCDELQDDDAPAEVRAWLSAPPTNGTRY
jgi:hypothetical protein